MTKDGNGEDCKWRAWEIIIATTHIIILSWIKRSSIILVTSGNTNDTIKWCKLLNTNGGMLGQATLKWEGRIMQRALS